MHASMPLHGDVYLEFIVMTVFNMAHKLFSLTITASLIFAASLQRRTKFMDIF